MIVKTAFQQKLPSPLLFRFLEGISTFFMPIGFIWFGGDFSSSLFLIYILHFISSFIYHMYPSPLTYYLDISLINLMIMERGYLKTQNLWVYVLCLISMWIEHVKSHKTVLHRAGIVCLLGNISPLYLYFWVMTGIFYLCSSEYLEEYPLLSSLTCVLYHFYLGLLSAIEVEMYYPSSSNPLSHFLRYLFYFLFLCQFSLNLTRDPKHLRSILSFLTAVVLSPWSMYQIHHQLQMEEYKLFQEESSQVFMLLFYLAYVVVDTGFGILYYPQYFPFLEGWVHHLATTLFVSYYLLRPPFRVLCCMNMIIETSGILLFLSRIFHHVRWIQKLKRVLFYDMFLLFRIIIPTMLIIYYYSFYNMFVLFVYMSTTAVNLYWFVRLSQK